MSDERGIQCPGCGCKDLRASYRKPWNGGYRRVRICRNCGRRVITFEAVTGNGTPRDSINSSINRIIGGMLDGETAMPVT